MAKRSTSLRERLTNAAGTFFTKRSAGGEFKEMDERGRSLRADRAKKAKRVAASGHGDQGIGRPARRPVRRKKRAR